MKKTAFIIMIITLVSKLFGFIRDIVLSYFFGATNISDAYLISLTIPSVIFGLIGTGIMTAYIPMQSRIVNEYGEDEGSKFTSNFTNIIMILVTVIFAIGIFFTEPIVKIFAIGFSGETLETTIRFTKISLFGMYFTALLSIFSGYLQIKNNYIAPTLIGFPLNVIVIISIILASGGNSIILAYGTLFAIICQFIMMIPFIKRTNFKYSLFISWKDDRILRTLYIALPVIVGTSVNQMNILVDKTIASSIAIGGISSLNYANRLNLFVQSIFVYSIITVMYPLISSYANLKNYEGIKKVLIEAINAIVLFVMPLTIGSMIFSHEIIYLLFGRGAFNSSALLMTSEALFFYAVGMIGFGLREVIARGFYALQDTKTPMINASIGVIINIFLNILLSRYIGIGGLALATSISAIITTVLLFYSLRKKIGSLGLKKIISSFIKILIASLLMGYLSKCSFDFLTRHLSQSLSLFISISVGFVSYFIIIYFMKIDEIHSIVSAIRKKLSRES